MNDATTVASRVWGITAKVFVAASGLLLGLLGGGIIGLLTGLIEISC